MRHDADRWSDGLYLWSCKGNRIGSSLSEPDKVETARSAIAKAEKLGVKLVLPVDHLASDKIDFAGNAWSNQGV